MREGEGEREKERESESEKDNTQIHISSHCVSVHLGVAIYLSPVLDEGLTFFVYTTMFVIRSALTQCSEH